MIKKVFLLAISWAWAVNSHAQTINDFFDEGVKLQEQGKYVEAIAKFSDVVKKDKFYHEAWYHRAVCYAEQKKYEPAINDLTEALKAKKDYFEAFLKRSELYLTLNKQQDALNDLNHILLLKQDYLKAYEKRAELYLKIPDKKINAYNDLQKAIELNKESMGL